MRSFLPRGLIINRGFSFPSAVSLDSRWRGSLCNTDTCILVIPTRERTPNQPTHSRASPPSFGLGRRRLPNRHGAWPSPSRLALAWRGLGAATPSLSALPMSCPALPQRPPLARVSGERRSWSGVPRPSCRRGRASVTRGPPGWALLSRRCWGWLEEETPGVALGTGDTFPGL